LAAGVRRIVLNARHRVLPETWYAAIGDAKTLFDVVRHVRIIKLLY